MTGTGGPAKEECHREESNARDGDEPDQKASFDPDLFHRSS